jgi:hypothetical protein
MTTTTIGPVIMVSEPTGIATEDRRNIQDAIDQAATYGGGTVMLQKGVYFLEPFTTNNYTSCIYLYQGVHLLGSGVCSTTLYAENSDCHVVLSDPAQLMEDGINYMPKNGIWLKDFQVVAGVNSGSYTGIYLKGVMCFLIENVLVNGNYANGCHFNRGIHVKGWVGTLINCAVNETYQGYNLSWDDDLDGLRPDNTNAVELIGCHYEGGNLLPESGNLVGCYINGFGNHFSGSTIERRLTVPTANATGVYIKEDSGNTFTGCYFEGWPTTFTLDGCSGTTITGGFMMACYGIDSIQYLNGADAIANSNIIQNVSQITFVYENGTWTMAGSSVRDNLGRLSIAPNGTTPDNGYNGNIVITKPSISGQYINMVRSANFVWSIGTVYNTNDFAIGPGQDVDSNFNNPSLTIQTNGNVGLGTTVPYGKLTVQGGTPDAGDLFIINNAEGKKIGGLYPDGANSGVLHILDNDENKKIQLYSNGSSWITGNFGAGTTTPETQLHLGGANAVVTVAKTNNTPPVPGTADKARIYVKGDKLVIQYKDGTLTRYKWLLLTGTGVSWQQSTTAP